MTLRKGIVVGSHPEDHSVDLVMCDDGARLSGVPVLSGSASARSGSVDMPEMPNKTGEAKWDITQRHGQDMEALVGFMGRSNPVVVGFLYPQVSQMTFEDKKRRFNRHQSDVYHTVDGSGNMELFHPSGAYVRIAESTEHEDLAKKNYDKNMELDRNKDKKVKFHIQSADGKAAVTIDIDGKITIKAATKITCDTPLLEVPNGDVVASGISLVKHVHTGVKPGSGLSGVPLGGGGSGGSLATSSPGTPETAGTMGNGVAKNATGVYPFAVFTRLKYGEDPNFTGVGNALGIKVNYFKNIPNDKDKIPEETYYQRVRPGYVYIQDVVVSNYNAEADSWTDDAFNKKEHAHGLYFGSIPEGISKDIYDGPFEVFKSPSTDELYAKYCDAVHRYSPMGEGAGSYAIINNVFWKLTPEEFEEHGEGMS